MYLSVPKEHFYPLPRKIVFETLKAQQLNQILHHKGMASKEFRFFLMSASPNTALRRSPVMFQPFLLSAPDTSYECLQDTKHIVERCRGVNECKRSPPACWGCCSNWEQAQMRDIHGKLLLWLHNTLRLNLRSCKPMNSAYLVSDTVSCEILFYKQRNISNRMATFTHFKVSSDFPFGIKRHCSSTQVSYLQQQSLHSLC